MEHGAESKKAKSKGQESREQRAPEVGDQKSEISGNYISLEQGEGAKGRGKSMELGAGSEELRQRAKGKEVRAAQFRISDCGFRIC